MTSSIQHVSDTSAWVAYYRALESKRPDALFQDTYAESLVGNRASHFARLKSNTTKWTQWTVIMRTLIIDQMILDLKEKGCQAVLNLGAGLDSRPYRLNLGSDVQWIEVDYPHVIDYKTKILQNEIPRCSLERIGLDLSDRSRRQALFSEIAQKHSQIVVLTEGVLPYLSVDQVSELSEDLMIHPSFQYWIGEYISPQSYRYLKNPKRMRLLQNAPFQFYPEDWIGFFQSRGWNLKREEYYTETSEKVGRRSPMPFFFKILELIKGSEWAKSYKQMSGYLLWSRRP